MCYSWRSSNVEMYQYGGQWCQQKPIIMDGGQDAKGVVSDGDKQCKAHAKYLATRARASTL